MMEISHPDYRAITEEALPSADFRDFGASLEMLANVCKWTRLPPLALYHGETSFCRIDGPRQWVKDRSFPLGGLILSPGVTAHLDPFEARELQEHMEWAIEQAIRQWIADHDLHDLSPVPGEFDRRKADRKAKAKIADWAARQERNRPVADDDAEGPDHA